MRRPSILARVLSAALGLDLADFNEARVFLRSPEGDALLEEWLAAHRNEPGDPDTTTTERTTP